MLAWTSTPGHFLITKYTKEHHVLAFCFYLGGSGSSGPKAAWGKPTKLRLAKPAWGEWRRHPQRRRDFLCDATASYLQQNWYCISCHVLTFTSSSRACAAAPSREDQLKQLVCQRRRVCVHLYMSVKAHELLGAYQELQHSVRESFFHIYTYFAYALSTCSISSYKLQKSSS